MDETLLSLFLSHPKPTITSKNK